MARALLVLAGALLFTAGVVSGVERGNRLYRVGEYESAVVEYREAIRAGDDSPVVRYNLGTALLSLGRYAEAEEHLRAALEAVDPEVRQWVHYNLGQRYLEEARSVDPGTAVPLYDAAVDAYRQALRLRPDDRDAKWNYELALKEREEAQQQAGQGQSGDQGQPGDESGDQGEPGEEPGEPQDQGEQPRPQGGQEPLTREQAERILSGVEQDERELFQDQLRQGQPVRTTRDW